MNIALLIGKHKSGGVPGKNYMELLGRPMVEYPLMAAFHSKLIDKIYVSTDSDIIKQIARKYDAEIIDRPPEMARSDSPTEFVFSHAYEHIKKVEKGDIGLMSLMFANSVDVLPKYLDQGIEKLNSNDQLDSVISLSQYNMFTPLRARRLQDDGRSVPTLDLDSLGVENTFDRDALGDVYFADFGVQIVRPERCLVYPTAGALPFRWLGKEQGAIVKDFGFDIDDYWQIPVMEFWLKEHGFSLETTPYDSE
jgi:CMP-N-acetylneuraminic acid synthetase